MHQCYLMPNLLSIIISTFVKYKITRNQVARNEININHAVLEINKKPFNGNTREDYNKGDY